MYVITGKHTWSQIKAQLVGVCFFSSKNPLVETVKKQPPCALAIGEVEFHLVTDLQSERVFICLHSDGLCIQYSGADSTLAKSVFEALRGHLVAASHLDIQQEK